jgi:hypothetical protein
MVRILFPAAIGIGMAFAFPARAAEPEPVMAGAGKAKFGVLLQSWLVNDTTGPATTPRPNFRLRRAELKFNGSVADDTRWFAMIDAAKTLRTGPIASTNDNKILQDLGVAFTLMPALELLAGQFKTPATAEGLDSSFELLFPERAYVARTYGDRREPGAMLAWKKDDTQVRAMVSNGQGANIDDTNNSKDLTLRVDQAVGDLKLGAFTTAGDFRYSRKSRFGANARYTISGLLLRGEAVTANDNGTKSEAWTADAGYQLTERAQPIARIEGYSTGSVTGTAFSVGLNYFVAKHGAKIQAQYTLLDDFSGSSGTYTASSGAKGTLFIVSLQAAL